MSRGDRRHVGGRFYRWGPVVLVLALLASAGASYRFDLGERWLGIEQGDPVDNPGAVAPPRGLDLPEALPAAEVAAPVTPAPPGSISPGSVRKVLGRRLLNPDLGGHVFADVTPLSGGRPAFVEGSGEAVPASTMKLLTTTAALAALPPGTTFPTTVVESGPGRLVLVGGGDPYLLSKPPTAAERNSTYPARADVVTLARRTAESLRARGVEAVRLGYDDSLFTGPVASPAWEASYLPDGVVAPITALWVDRGADPSGYGRVADPSARAAAVFAKALGRAGVQVRRAPRPAVATAGATEVARVESAPVEQIVQHVLEVSDNEGAEVLGHQVGMAVSGDGSFAGGVAGVLTTLRGLGINLDGAVLHDGSGLSRRDRLSPRTLVEVLQTAAGESHPELRPVLEGLPVAGFTGSLSERFVDGDPAGRGRVRAKTGTLSGVHGLAGIVSDLDGNLMVLVLIADRVKLEDTLDARAVLDRAAAALAGCHCGSPA